MDEISSKRKDKYDRAVVLCFDKRSGEYAFYGNLKALFDDKEIEQNDGSLGVSYNYIKNLFGKDNHYENDFVLIHKGTISTLTKKEWKRNPGYGVKE